ncbi:MAG: hypothetical protein ACP5P9_01300, partial [Acidimicrobiales bacterium]
MDLVVILGVVWLAVLGPGVWRRYREYDSVASVLHFHRQLRVLEDAEPQPLVLPAFRLRSVDGSDDPVAPTGSGGQPRPVLSVVGADRLPRAALACLADEAAAGPASQGPTGSGGRRAYGPTSTPRRLHGPVQGFDHVAEARHLARRRRRDILTGLVTATLLTFLIGFVPGAGLAWLASVIFAVTAAAYVALLAHHRALALERERKLRYLGDPARRAVRYDDARSSSGRRSAGGGVADAEPGASWTSQDEGGWPDAGD